MNKNVKLVLIALAVIVVVAVGFSQFASSEPDGLEYVAQTEGFDSQAADHSLQDAPLADYGGDSRTGTMISGAIGIVVTLGIGYGLFVLVRKNHEPTSSEH